MKIRRKYKNKQELKKTNLHRSFSIAAVVIWRFFTIQSVLIHFPISARLHTSILVAIIKSDFSANFNRLLLFIHSNNTIDNVCLLPIATTSSTSRATSVCILSGPFRKEVPGVLALRLVCSCKIFEIFKYSETL